MANLPHDWPSFHVFMARVAGEILDMATRPRTVSFPPRGPGEPPAPTSSNCDVLCILPDGRRGFFDGRCLWTTTGTTIHSREDAEDSAADLTREYGHKARFFAVDAEYGEWDPICDIDGVPVTRTTCERCGFADVFDGPICNGCVLDDD